MRYHLPFMDLDSSSESNSDSEESDCSESSRIAEPLSDCMVGGAEVGVGRGAKRMRGDLASAGWSVGRQEGGVAEWSVGVWDALSKAEVGKPVLPRLAEDWPTELMLETESCDSKRFSS